MFAISSAHTASYSSNHGAAAEPPLDVVARTATGQGNNPLLAETQGNAISVMAADEACADASVARCELSSETWADMAAISVRGTVLNPRAVSDLQNMGSDQSMTRIAVRGGARLHAFADANAFLWVKTLKLIDCGDADLVYLGAALTQHPRPHLCLELDHGNTGITARGFAALRTATFHSLQMKFGVLDTLDVHALSMLKCDMAITAYSSPDSLVAMANIPGLRQLWPIRSVFDEVVARAFRDHPLTELTLVSCRDVSSLALQHMAGNRSLRVLNLDSANAAFDVDAARAFAENQTLKTLALQHPMHHFLKDDACAALSENRALKVLSIPVPTGLHYLGRMVSLEGLHLQGLTQGLLQTAPAIREYDAHQIVLGLRLQWLGLTRVQFMADALAVLLGGIRASKLYLTGTALDSHAVSALLSNRHVIDINLVGVQIASADAVALASHPSLVRLSIGTSDDQANVPFPLDVIQALHAAWQKSGRPLSQLGGALALA